MQDPVTKVREVIFTAQSWRWQIARSRKVRYQSVSDDVAQMWSFRLSK